MQSPELNQVSVYGDSLGLSRVAVAGAVAFAMLGYGVLLSDNILVGKVFTVAGSAVLLVSALAFAASILHRRSRSVAVSMFTKFIEKDASPSILTDGNGEVLARNHAAGKRFSGAVSSTLGGVLRSVFANPDAVIYRLQCKAKDTGNAQEDIVTRKGHVRLALHLVDDVHFLWRFEDMFENGAGHRTGGDVSGLPMVTVGRNGTILFMNEAARGLIGARVKSLADLFVDLPPKPGQVNALSTRSGQMSVVVSEVSRTSVRGELVFVPLDDPETETGPSIDSLPVAILKADMDGIICGANRLALEMLGTCCEVGVSLADVMEGMGRPVQEWIAAASDKSKKPVSEFLHVKRKDCDLFVQATLNLVSENGKQVLIAVLSDATELKTLEAQFVQSQKMQAIGQLAGGVAHDFNNLLTAISGHCDLLLLRHNPNDPEYGDLVQIHQNANRAAALVGQLLAYSRKQTLRPELLDLRVTLSDLTHLLNRLVGERVTLTLIHDPILKPIRADKRQLEQVIMNLVVNARDAMPDGGEIRIETGIVKLDKPMQRDRAELAEGEYIAVRVRDEGTGIPADKVSKIFEPFFTTKRTGEGTGLGLSTAYGIVKQTGGYIFVDSVVGQGTEFLIYFPAAEQADIVAVPKPDIPTTTSVKDGDGVVLLVEDEAPVRAFASRALRLRGYTVLEADSAETALQTLEDRTLDVDVFVTDVVMPGMDGPSWVRQALKDRPDTRVVFVSGYAQGAFTESEAEIPNSVFLPKPFSLTQLTDTVHQQMT